ncbi:MAG: MnmC family methyltransferase [Limisphaerales bacterium]
MAGPADEARTLYVEGLRLKERLAQAARPLVIWDVGIGAAGNALAALRALSGHAGAVRLVSFDLTRAGLAFARRHAAELGYFAGFEDAVDALLKDGAAAVVRGGFRADWRLMEADFPGWLETAEADATPAPHAVFFDPNSPVKNPEMWTLPVFAALRARCDPARPCALATYSRSTLVRTALLRAGFFVGAGPAVAGKEETTLAATTAELAGALLGARWLERVRRSHAAEPLAGPTYRQAPLAAATLAALEGHPQFGGPPA